MLGDAVNIIKQFQQEEMIAIEPLYINTGTADAHGDGISELELDKLIANFNKNIANIQGNLHHSAMTDGFKPIQAYRLPMDVLVGDPSVPETLVLIPEGQPIVKIQFADTDVGRKLWEARKSGKIRGVSIGAKGVRVPNPDYKPKDNPEEGLKDKPKDKPEGKLERNPKEGLKESPKKDSKRDLKEKPDYKPT